MLLTYVRAHGIDGATSHGGMASASLPSAPARAAMRRPDAAPAAPSDRAVYRLAKPLRDRGTLASTPVIEMRGIADQDRELLEHYRGNTVALTRELIGALCSLSPDQVAHIARTDYAMLAEDVQWQMEEAAQRFGLPRSYFTQAKGSEA